MPLGTNNLVQWKIIQALKREGVAVYDFGGARPNVAEGSKFEQLQKFKARFGGQFRPAVLWSGDFRPFASTLFRLAKRILNP